MPSYQYGATTVGLSHANLEKTITERPIAYPGRDQSKHLDEIAREFAEGFAEHPVSEDPILTSEPRPSHLRFLGPQKDMPFLLVRTGIDKPRLDPQEEFGKKAESSRNIVSPADEIGLVFRSGQDQDKAGQVRFVSRENFFCGRTPASNQMERLDRGVSDGVISSEMLTDVSGPYHASFMQPEKLPNPRPRPHPNALSQALCLTVQLSNRSFLPEPNTKKTDLKPLDIKIDVYFNGELCASSLVSQRMHGNSSELTQRFTGRRIDRLLERPWVIGSAGRDAQNYMRYNRRPEKKSSEILKRWTAISEMLKVEAEKAGRHRRGGLSVLGEYLMSLSQFPIPEELEVLQGTNGLKLGVVDVIITAGRGKKDDPRSGYINNPTGLRLSELRPPRLTQKPRRHELDNITGLEAVESTATTCAQAFAGNPNVAPAGNPHKLVERNDLGRFSRQRLMGAELGGQSAASVEGSCGAFRVPLAPSSAPAAIVRRQSAKKVNDTSKSSKESTRPLDKIEVQSERARGGSALVREGGLPISLQDQVSNSKPATRSTRAGHGESIVGIPDRKMEEKHIPETRFEGSDVLDKVTPQPKRRKSTVGHLNVTTNKLPLTGAPIEIEKAAAQATEDALRCINSLNKPKSSSRRENSQPTYRGSTTERRAVSSSSLEMPITPTMVSRTTLAINRSINNSTLGLPNPQPTTKSPTSATSSPPPSRSLSALSSQFSSSPAEVSTTHAPFSSMSAETSFPHDAGMSNACQTAINQRQATTARGLAEAKAGCHKEKTATHKSGEYKPVEIVPPEYETPSLSKDCAVSYAEGKIRQVRSERGGYFKESFILMGVRYVVS